MDPRDQIGFYVTQVRRGEREAARILVGLFSSATYARAFSNAADLEQARTLTRDAFVRTFRAIHNIQNPEEFPTALARTLSGMLTIASAARAASSGGSTRADESGALPGGHSLSGSVKLRAHRMGREALARLEPAQRALGLLAFVEGMKSEQIATTLGETVDEVRRALVTATRRLEADLRKGSAEIGVEFGFVPDPAAPPSPPCAHPREMFIPLHEGALGPAELAAFKTHLESCEGCRVASEQLRTARDVIGRQLLNYRLGDRFADEVLQELGPLSALAASSAGAPTPFAAGSGCLPWLVVGGIAGGLLGIVIGASSRGNYYSGSRGYGRSSFGWMSNASWLDIVAEGFAGACMQFLFYGTLLWLSMRLLPAGWPVAPVWGRAGLTRISRLILAIGAFCLFGMIAMVLPGSWWSVNSDLAGLLVIMAAQLWPPITLSLAAGHVFYAIRDYAEEMRSRRAG